MNQQRALTFLVIGQYILIAYLMLASHLGRNVSREFGGWSETGDTFLIVLFRDYWLIGGAVPLLLLITLLYRASRRPNSTFQNLALSIAMLLTLALASVFLTRDLMNQATSTFRRGPITSPF